MAKLKKGLLRISYEVSGKNIKYLPEYLHIKKVCVYKFYLKTENTCFITIDFADNDKFFAICKNMCYNKKVTGYKGILSPLAKVVCSIGLSLGILLFSLSSYLLGGVLLGVKVEGSAKCFANETIATVKSLGVEKYDLFSSINYDEIEREVLKSNQKISFVSVYKRGNFLIVSAELSSGVTEPLSKSDGDLVSTCNGVIEELSVLRGTALVNVGDTVKVGDVLVGAYLLGKDETPVNTFIVARVKILETLQFKYENLVINDRAVELCYALSEFKTGGEIKEKSYEIIGDKIVVTLVVRRVLYGGNS